MNIAGLSTTDVEKQRMMPFEARAPRHFVADGKNADPSRAWSQNGTPQAAIFAFVRVDAVLCTMRRRDKTPPPLHSGSADGIRLPEKWTFHQPCAGAGLCASLQCS